MMHFIVSSEADLRPEEKLFTRSVQVFAPRPSSIARVVSLALQLAGLVAFLFIAFGLIAMVQS